MKTLTANAIFMATLLAASSMACSQSPSQHPAGIGDCQGSATSCGVGPAVGSNTGSTNGSGGGTGVDSATGATCGALSSADPSCEACLEQSCCTPAITCSNTDECIAYSNCIRLCQASDQPCIAGCQNLHTTGLPAYNTYIGCLATSCGVPCQLVDAGTNCGSLVFNGACESCVSQSCCSQAANCSNDPDCLTLGSCLQSCPSNDTNCVANCQALAPNGVGTYSSLGTCIQGSCAAACQ